MDKAILQEYIDACELVKDIGAEIQKLNRQKKSVVQDSVKGSSHGFPYVEQHFKIQGTAFNVKDDDRLRREEKLLEQQKAKAEQIKQQVEAWMLTIPSRMQRIIRFRIFEGCTWEQVANRLGRKATGESVRKEFENFIKK